MPNLKKKMTGLEQEILSLKAKLAEQKHIHQEPENEQQRIRGDQYPRQQEHRQEMQDRRSTASDANKMETIGYDQYALARSHSPSRSTHDDPRDYRDGEGFSYGNRGPHDHPPHPPAYYPPPPPTHYGPPPAPTYYPPPPPTHYPPPLPPHYPPPPPPHYPRQEFGYGYGSPHNHPPNQPPPRPAPQPTHHSYYRPPHQPDSRSYPAYRHHQPGNQHPPAEHALRRPEQREMFSPGARQRIAERAGQSTKREELKRKHARPNQGQEPSESAPTQSTKREQLKRKHARPHQEQEPSESAPTELTKREELKRKHARPHQEQELWQSAPTELTKREELKRKHARPQ
ncbi:Hypothetical predicted protein [Lecanosticta acicola]|uniref:Uncharacterized protein n=1 Tax=Lecanosticta acicola TaxID=111012 RepID=A0AAI8Z851_9PEZI|nr:Hypothetical predicted protein [Lecanosticta acicola]